MNAVNVYLGIEPRQQRFFAKDDKRCSYQIYELCPDGRLVDHYMKDGVSDPDVCNLNIDILKGWGYEEIKMNSVVNYIVHLSDWYGRRSVECNTTQEVWEAIGKMSFGGSYQVESPTGKDVSDFIPF